MDSCTHNEIPCFSLQTSIHKICWKRCWSALSTTLGRNPHRLACTKVRLDQKLSIAAQSSLSSIDRVQNCLCLEDILFYTLRLLAHKRNVTNLFYCCFHGKYSDVLHALVPPVQTFISKNAHATYTESNHPHFPRLPFVRRTFQLAFVRTLLYFRNTFPHEFFPEN